MIKLRSRRDDIDKTGVDCSDPMRKQFVEIQPFSVDPDTGEILNQTNQVTLKEVAPINQDEAIQSYFESTDLKTVLNRIRSGSGEAVPAYDGTGSYVDLANMPKNIMELDRYLKEKKTQAVNVQNKESSVSQVSPVSDDELDKRIKSYLDRKFAAASAVPDGDSKKEDK